MGQEQQIAGLELLVEKPDQQQDDDLKPMDTEGSIDENLARRNLTDNGSAEAVLELEPELEQGPDLESELESQPEPGLGVRTGCSF